MALKGIRVLELAGLAPAPFAGMILSDFGANVLRVDRLSPTNPDALARGKKSISLNLKSAEGQSIVRKLCKNTDVIIEPFRTGVMEKLNLGPEELMKENPKLVYCRLSGYGQKGPYKSRAGHDINYIATSGVLEMLQFGGDKPTPPINVLADFAGGGLMAAFGVVSALFERTNSGKGQVIDANMVQGSAYVSSFLFLYRSLFPNLPGHSVLDGGAPFYDTYQTKDGKYVAVGAIEPQFYDQLIKGLKLNPDEIPAAFDMKSWPELREIIKSAISHHTQDELSVIFAGDNTCVSPILDRNEAAELEHNKVSNTFFRDDVDGKVVPNPAPLLTRTPAHAAGRPQPQVGGHSIEVLQEHGYTKNEIKDFISNGVVYSCNTSKL